MMTHTLYFVSLGLGNLNIFGTLGKVKAWIEGNIYYDVIVMLHNV